jgi:16S rRNA (guanine966-N2)-methyltransferase
MLRITGGEFRGRFIQAPANLKTRPTQARLRQALFNSLQHQIADARVLDLFAGSGALGFEALSWGAASVSFVELARPVCQLIEKNADSLGVRDRIRVHCASVDSILPDLKREAPYDLVLADPPYAGGWELKLLENLPWGELLRAGGKFCLEWGVQKSRVAELPESAPFLVKVREKNYGDSVLTTYEATEPGAA